MKLLFGSSDALGHGDRAEEGFVVVGEQFGAGSELHLFVFLGRFKGIFTRLFGVLGDKFEDNVEV